jgi:hypothetical protein
MSKDEKGNLLLARLSKVFEQEYKTRTEKCFTMKHLPDSGYFDLEEYSIEDLRKAYAYFSCLSSAFESNAQRSSSKFCNAIVACISNALDTHSEARARVRETNALNYEGGGYTTVKRRLNRMGM